MKCKDCLIVLKNSNIHNTESKKTKGICIGCEDNELKIKQVCFICKKTIYNDFSRFLNYGNLCYACSIKTTHNLMKIKEQKRIDIELGVIQ